MPGALFDSVTVFGNVGESGLHFGARNTVITAGADLRFRSLFNLEPAFEFRGTYAVGTGPTASENDFLYGPVLRTRYRILHPYVNYLVGRGAITYQGAGYVYQGDIYTKSFTAIHSTGGGLDVDLTPSLSLKADAQWQLQWVPIRTPDHLRARSATVGVQYRLHMPHREHKPKPDIHDGTWQTLHSRYPGMDAPQDSTSGSQTK